MKSMTILLATFALAFSACGALPVGSSADGVEQLIKRDHHGLIDHMYLDGNKHLTVADTVDTYGGSWLNAGRKSLGHAQVGFATTLATYKEGIKQLGNATPKLPTLPGQ